MQKKYIIQDLATGLYWSYGLGGWSSVEYAIEFDEYSGAVTVIECMSSKPDRVLAIIEVWV